MTRKVPGREARHEGKDATGPEFNPARLTVVLRDWFESIRVRHSERGDLGGGEGGAITSVGHANPTPTNRARGRKHLDAVSASSP